jgi:hypothetical protein
MTNKYGPWIAFNPGTYTGPDGAQIKIEVLK